MGYSRMLLFFIPLLSLGQTAMIDTKELRVIEIDSLAEMDLAKVGGLLESHTELQAIDIVNWETHPYRPQVHFRIAHSANQIWLKFYVKEGHILAKRTATNSATHKDSCVEFFMDPKGDGNYYNFEFNCIGVTHLAYGPDRKQRMFVDPKRIEEGILVESSLGNEPFEEQEGGHEWEMTLVLPASLMVHHEGLRLKGLQAQANFYKCADDTAAPHFLSWNPVGTPRPDFHQPSFFGTLIFE